MIVDALLMVFAGYLAIGFLIGLVFVTRVVQRVDHAAVGSGPVFRLLILPGCAALWPWVLKRWFGSRGANS